jgi:hypothetical protein
MLSYILIFSFFIYVYNLTCDRHTCSKIGSDNVCMTANPTTTNGVTTFDINVSLCGRNLYCNYGNRMNWSNSTLNKFTCAEDPVGDLKVHGEKCTKGSECFSGNCTAIINLLGSCTGIGNNSACSDTRQCISGYYCDASLKVCKQQKTNGSCLIDEECENYMGCYNNVCTTLWSLPDLSPINDTLASLYCQTRFSYQGKCHGISNSDKIPFSCNDTCKYKIIGDNDEIEIKENCVCGYNEGGNKYCQQGSDSITYSLYNETIFKNLQLGCHVSKKLSCTNIFGNKDIINMQSLYLAWKGYYQYSSQCINSFYSISSYISLSSTLLIFAISMIFI